MRNQQKLVIGVLFLSIIFLGFFQNAKVSKAQPQYSDVTKTLTAPLSFSMYEFSENIENKENITSIDLSLPSPSWNLTDIEVNFTDIKFNREILEIENTQSGDYEQLDYAQKGLAVQINITYRTIIYGIHLYGSARNPVSDVDLQIRGYDPINHIPTSQVFAEKLNVNITEDVQNWYIQSFDDPVELEAGNYSLVLNGFALTWPADRDVEYRWYYNNDEPMNPSLYSSYYVGPNWVSFGKGYPFLYKLDQEFNFTFNPKDINMQAKINGDYHPVLNGVDPIKGNLTIPDVDYSSNEKNITISILNNRSSSLLFNATYSYSLKHILNSGGTVSIKESFNNTWTINPNFMRPFTNPSNKYSIKFEYPTSWFNLTVFNSTGELIKSIDYIDDDQSIYILNDTITTDMGWKITANSEKVPFDADTELDSYLPGQLLKIPMTLPPSIEKTNLTVVLLGRDGLLEYNYTEDDPPEIYIFEYAISYNEIGGTWTALIYWNNKSDASVQSQVFTISGTPLSSSSGGSGGGGSTTITGLDPLLVLTISTIIILAIAGSLTSYQMVKRVKRKRDLQMQKLHNKVMDSLNLNYIMISENNSGLNIYEQFFVGKNIDPTLISGFLTAIRSFGIELAGTFQQSQTIKLEFQNSKILMNEFRHFRVILIMGENPSDDFIESINNLSYDIEKEYGELIRDFDGSLNEFTGIGKLIEHHLNVSFLFPLKVISSGATKPTPAESSVFNKAREIMKQNNLGYIFTSFLMDDQIYEPKRIKAIFGLIEKGIFQPIRLEDQNLKH